MTAVSDFKEEGQHKRGSPSFLPHPSTDDRERREQNGDNI
jgi:hypothetical protein